MNLVLTSIVRFLSTAVFWPFRARAARFAAIPLALLALPATSFAQGVDLSWRNCLGTGLETSHQNFTCSGGVDQNYNLVVQFKSPVTLPRFVGMTVWLELQNTTPGPLAPFWHYASGGCNRSTPPVGIAMFDNIQQLPGCDTMADLWGGDGTQGFEGIAAYGANYRGPGTGAFILYVARGSSIQLDAFVNYYAFHLTFNNRNRATCAGCDQGVALKVSRLILESDDGSPAVVLTGPDKFGDCVTINSASPAVCTQMCPPETCDGLDNDCDGQTDEGVTRFRDADGDGYGDPAVTTTGCPTPSGYVSNASDCDDTHASVHPGATETCDGLDNDCDGPVDESTLPPTGLVAWWKAEGNANDATGNYHGTLQNGASFDGGQIGQAFSLDGVNDYVGDLGTTSDFSFIQNTGVFTIEGWVLQTTINSASRPISANISTNAEKGHYFGVVNNLGQQQLQLILARGTSGSHIIESRSPEGVMTPGWHHVAVSGDETQVTFHVDGVSYAGTGTMGSLSTGSSSHALNIGHDGALSYFAGRVDELAIYDRELTSAEVQRLFTGGSDGRCLLLPVDEPPSVGSTIRFGAPWPNPTSGTVDLEFQMPTAAPVRAQVVDVAGRRVASLVEGREMPAGRHRLQWDGRDDSGRPVLAGIYQIQISAGGRTAVRRVAMIH